MRKAKPKSCTRCGKKLCSYHRDRKLCFACIEILIENRAAKL